jgi:hypothetical protein
MKLSSLFSPANIKNNLVYISLAIFLASYFIINYFKPGFLYNTDGSLRQFGLNSSKRTVVPVWLLSIMLAILSYVLVWYYVLYVPMIY